LIKLFLDQKCIIYSITIPSNFLGGILPLDYMETAGIYKVVKR